MANKNKNQNVPSSVVAVIYNHKGEVLVVSRKNNLNDFGLPGGKIEPSDETSFDAICREVLEETGYEITMLSVPVFGDYAENHFCIAFIGKVNLESQKTIKETGVVKFMSIEELIKQGTYRKYNVKLFNKLKKLKEIQWRKE